MTVDTIALRKKIGSVFIARREFEEAIGKSRSFVSNLLNGRVVDTLDLGTIYKIVDVLNLNVNDILNIFFKE